MKLLADLTNSSPHTKRHPALRIALLTIALLAVAGFLQAEMNQQAPGEQGDGSSQNIQELEREYKQLKIKIDTLRKKCLAQDPKLKKQKEELDTLVEKTMEMYMKKLGVDVERLQELYTILRQGNDMSRERKEKLIEEYETKLKAYQQARQKTLKDPEVQSKQSDFQDNLITAMKKEEPRIEAMYEKMQGLQLKIQQMRG